MTRTAPARATPLLPAVALSSRDTVHHADLFALCRAQSDASIDMILCDLPYGTTACSWDTVIPFAPMWAQFKRVIKPRGAIVLTASQPFTSALVMSNPGMFRYSWVWHKTIATQFLDAERKPLKAHEDILVFGIESPVYFPVMVKGDTHKRNSAATHTLVYGKADARRASASDLYYPLSIIKFANARGLHPTQKPVALFEYLIRTYTQPGDLVFDPCAGSGTTAIACRNLDRHYVCGDSDAGYVAIARKRLQDTDPYQSTTLSTGAIQPSLFEGLAS